MILRNLINKRFFSNDIKKPFFVTTPIFYVNAAPHIGHLYSAVIADTILRFEQLLDQHSTDYFLTTGTDEHGSKIQQAASANNVSTEKYCNQISNEYKALFKNSNINYNHFIRTTDQQHKVAVQAFWNTLKEKDNIYHTKYAGWYCIPDESFLTESQLTEKNGQKVSAESGHPVEWTEEENYMFRLSKYQDDILYWLKSGNRVKPKKFEKILLDNLQEPLPDISVSRPSSRVFWGIQVPGDATQTVYVWLDALVNYLTCAGYPNENFKAMWPPSVQVVGKDIMKFHGIYWPAFLIAAGLEPPNQLLVHSHWTVDGVKMSKSKFNVVDPVKRAEMYTYDGMRYFLLREGVAHSDGNYSDTKIFRILNSELADTFGNLLSRVCAKSVNVQQIKPKFHTDTFKELSQMAVLQKLIDLLDALPDKCHHHYKAYNFYLVVDQVIEVLHTANNFFETTKPWELRKTNDIERLETVLRTTMECLRMCGIILQPIVPELSRTLLDKLNVDTEKRLWKDLSSCKLWENNCDVEAEKLGASNAILFRRMRAEEATDSSSSTKTKKVKQKNV